MKSIIVIDHHEDDNTLDAVVCYWREKDAMILDNKLNETNDEFTETSGE